MAETLTNSSKSSQNSCGHDPNSHLRNLDPTFMTYYFGAFALLTVVNVVGNWLVLTTICRHRSMWTPINGFICSLALTDLAFGVLYPAYNVAGIDVDTVTSVLGQLTVCSILQTEVLALTICSSYTLVLITITRYVSIAFPLRYHHYVTPRRSAFAVAILWIVSHIVCISIYWKKSAGKSYCHVCRYEMLFNKTQLSVLTSFQTGLPCFIMVVVYLRLVTLARRLNRQIGPATENASVQFESGWMHGPELASQRRQRSFVILTLLIGCYIISWTPIIVYLFLVLFDHSSRTDLEYFSATSRIMLFMNSAVNVFIYAGRMGEFRKYVRQDFHWLLSRCRTSRTTSRRNDIASTRVGMTTRYNT